MGLTMKPHEMIKFLEYKGFGFVRNKGSSHHIYSDGTYIVPIPIHKGKDYDEDFIRLLLREANITKKELLNYLKR